MPRIIEPPLEKSNTEGQRGKGRTFALALALLVLLALAFSIDGFVDRWVAENQVAAWHRAAQWCSRFFAWHWLIGYALLGLAIAWLRGRRDVARLLCAMMIAASLAGLAADVIRGLSGRTRPYYKEVPQGFYGVHDGSRWLITKHAFNSFPSGHTSAMTGFAIPLLFWRRSFILLVAPLIAAVAAARVYLGSHHLSDVVAAAILSSLIAGWVWRQAASGEWQWRGWRLRRLRR
jgi:membrane-associated phospholipid phosphatase